ncbi:MAG: VCBS repeat-containing protein [Planctomycetes bacterium]|nr:VCBS repeat-containing protein [Planctomycetota bacterium]
MFRNNQARFFVDTTSEARVATAGYGMGCAVGDVDNDGFPDLYVTNVGPNVLYRNNGDGTFSDITHEAGVGCSLWSTSCAFADLDRDGDLDLYVCNYVTVDPKIKCIDPSTKKPKYCGPDYYSAQKDVLYRNDGDGSFSDWSSQSGIGLVNGKGLGVVIADLKNDGWPDIFVANDLQPNFLFDNCGRLPFAEVAGTAGVAVNGDGIREANMGIACGDLSDSGLQDLYVTHYYMEHDTLFRNLGEHGFLDSTHMAGWPYRPVPCSVGAPCSATTISTAAWISSSPPATSTICLKPACPTPCGLNCITMRARWCFASTVKVQGPIFVTSGSAGALPRETSIKMATLTS